MDIHNSIMNISQLIMDISLNMDDQRVIQFGFSTF